MKAHVIILLALAAVAGCGRSGSGDLAERGGAGGEACCGESGASGERHGTRGIVRATGESDDVLFIEHEDIPGVMPSMTMPFVLGDAEAAGRFGPGDAVAFEFAMDERGAVAHGLRSVGVDEVKLPGGSVAPAAASNIPRLKVGDRWPDFELIGEDGRTLTQADFAGRHVVVTFLFVRCPVPNYCPLLTRKFARLQEELRADASLSASVRLLSVSFDPADTPPVLREYAASHGADPSIWRFATGDPAEIDALTRAFAVRIEKDGATIDHGLCTALLSPEGEVLEIWRGNEWKPEDVIDSLRPRPAAAL